MRQQLSTSFPIYECFARDRICHLFAGLRFCINFGGMPQNPKNVLGLLCLLAVSYEAWRLFRLSDIFFFQWNFAFSYIYIDGQIKVAVRGDTCRYIYQMEIVYCTIAEDITLLPQKLFGLMLMSFMPSSLICG